MASVYRRQIFATVPLQLHAEGLSISQPQYGTTMTFRQPEVF
ncbi:hypothetical protein ACZ87_01089 [Candidatus Erwinia dacicola]|uniref:Uncharacterized protein n=1 Tax=Candidatus Erwinia dacicola TaxID=252393 RepID=A0A328TN85_9GAMM|nr:hypothetical protein ACZ87_01089 [Candidatus Erwinia dacicola]